jgi:hypothetical protein
MQRAIGFESDDFHALLRALISGRLHQSFGGLAGNWPVEALAETGFS